MTIYLLAALVCAGLLFLLEAVVVEPRRFRIRRRTLACSHVKLARPLKILHLTDLHFRRRERFKMNFLHRLAAQEDVDLVAVTGDLADLTPAIPLCVEALRPFKPRFGLFVCLGGHDYFRTTGVDLVRQVVTQRRRRVESVDTNLLLESLRGIGAVVLVNERVELDVDGTPVDVIGLDDCKFGRPNFKAAFAGARPDAFRLALMHEPSMIEELAARGPDLVLLGHTHGGQVRLPFIGALVTQSRLDPKLASGVFEVRGTAFHLNNGVGTGEYTPLRTFCPPEATVLTILERGRAD